MSGDLHVMPHTDIVLHESNTSCVCAPECQPNELPDGSIAYVYVHHALDRTQEDENTDG